MPDSVKQFSTTRIRVVAGAVLRGVHVLAARRARGGPGGDLWELPGGKVQRGESDEEALIRELQEELGITVSVQGPLGISEFDYSEISIRLIGLCCCLTDDPLREPEAREHQELRWIDADGLYDLDWAPADLPLIASLEPILRAAASPRQG
jgi:8-oxo-dGTP diphosphatase